jgi:hypothetical protein
VKWLKLSVEEFEPIPNLQFSLKKPLLAASVILTYTQVTRRELSAHLEARAKIPFRDEFLYVADASTAKPTAAVSTATAPVLDHLFSVPAFAQTRDSQTSLYAGYIAVGEKTQALRIERKSATTEVGIETYEGKLIHVTEALSEPEWAQLPWSSKKSFEFDWSVQSRTIVAARFAVPLVGKIEITKD